MLWHRTFAVSYHQRGFGVRRRRVIGVQRQSGALSRVELGAAIYRETEMTRVQAASIVDAILNRIAIALARGEVVKFPHFGTFVLMDKVARPGRNPKTGDPYEIAPRRVVTFRASDSLKSRVQPVLPGLRAEKHHAN
ncbi:integration host factor subunit alpha [Novosphingobium sp. P6W]|uniref:integration host factor subunit alpha n=1 Tax=Novosphingobium sp. P6W TaxID=1609758 RepID=UPI0009E5CC43|nr:integration host factor subunit alpha [Novosphingobium sp. P6W]AXB79125.1 integration host factor subunit alpha [Novosphingobium sp. P6W]